MPLLVSSASGTNGNGYGALLAFDLDGRSLGVFSGDDRINDPRGLSFEAAEGLLFVNSGGDRVLALDSTGRVVRDTGRIAGFNPGGGTFGPDGRYYAGSRSLRTIMGFSRDLATPPGSVLPSGIVPFPRGFAFGRDGRLFLASGIGPNGEGENTIAAFSWSGTIRRFPLVNDPELSPLDLLLGPNGNILVSSEYPFASPDAVTTVREYDARGGNLVRVFSPGRNVDFRKPRGLRFGSDGHLYCVTEDGVVAFDLIDGECLGALVQWPRLNGQALEFLP
jgi:DNA-binding beta-propeller fold protein YncE